MSEAPRSVEEGTSKIEARYWSRRLSSMLHVLGRFGARIRAARLLFLLTLALAVLLAVGTQLPGKAVWVLVGLLLVFQLLNTYEKGDVRLDFERRMGIVQSSLSGDIDSLTQHLTRSSAHRLTEQQAKTACMGLLRRIKEYAEIVLDSKVDTRVRATLAVPILSPDRTVVTHVRVWCYDGSYADRRWSKLEMGLPGSPRAFATGKIVIIQDLWSLQEAGAASDRLFRSVVSVPVTLGGPDGERLAVVNLDAQPADYFRVDDIEAKLLPVIMPAVACIGLVLMSLEEDTIFEFGR